ncbi:MAG: hypothetical protein IJH91_09150 [Mogibacterium sp.]|nr:hypothetical protein [Mogibacterium sp.]
MSKGKQRPPQYIRQSKGYQQNMYKKQLKDKDIEMPKQIDTDKLIKVNRILGIGMIILTIVLLFWKGWKWALVLVLIGLLYVGGFFLYMQNYTKKFIKTYKAMGIPKDMYIKQLRKSGTDVKQIERMSKLWDKVKED